MSDDPRNDHDETTTPSRALEGLADAGTANTAHGRSLTAAESVEDWIVREARAISGPRTHLQDSEAVIQFGLRVARQVSKRNETQSWAVTVERNGESVVTLSSNMLAGRDLSDEDERVIRMAADHLLAFLGRAAVPVEEAAPHAQEAFDEQLEEDAEHLLDQLSSGDGEHSWTLDMNLIKGAFRRLLTWASPGPVAGAVPAPRCDHKFIDSTSCLKCGWTPEARP